MAEDEKAPKEEAQTPPETPKGGRPSRKGRKVDPPVSLFPLEFEEAVGALLQVRTTPEKKAGQ